MNEMTQALLWAASLLVLTLLVLFVKRQGRKDEDNPPRSLVRRILHAPSDLMLFINNMLEIRNTLERTFCLTLSVSSLSDRFTLYNEVIRHLSNKTLRYNEVPYQDPHSHKRTPRLVPHIEDAWFKFEGVWVHATSVQEDAPGGSGGDLFLRKQELFIYFMSHDKGILDKFRAYVEVFQSEQKQDRLKVYTARWSHWHETACRPHRPTDTLFYDNDLHLNILKAYETFKASPEAYERRGRIPKLTILLHGKPGVGKTVLALWLASQTKHHIALVTAAKISGDELIHLVSNLPERTILLLEEIDTITSKRKDTGDDDEDGDSPPSGQGKDDGTSRIPLGVLLNLLDGPLSIPGLVLMTTNYPERLDPALTRPGRVDLSVEIREPSPATAGRMFDSFFDQGGEQFAEALTQMGIKPSGALLEGYLTSMTSGADALAGMDALTPPPRNET